jgi:hypothetical protein
MKTATTRPATSLMMMTKQRGGPYTFGTQDGYMCKRCAEGRVLLVRADAVTAAAARDK